MKNIFIFLSISLLTLSCSSNEESNSYSPKYSNKWDEVQSTINKTWIHSKVDSTTPVRPGSLELPYEYFSIREGRNVLFGWDTYFTNAGLLLNEKYAIYAKNAVENQFAEIEQIGFVPNASEHWALNRAQIPYLSMMVREVYEAGIADKEWLKRAYVILQKDYLFWTDTSENTIENHNTSVEGLQRYFHHATKDELLQFYKELAPRFGYSDDLPEKEKLSIGEALMAEAESGMDFTPRFENRCQEFIAVDLNSNLYLYEINFVWMVKELNLSDEPNWNSKAETRKELLNKYCWSEERGLFMDYDFINKRFSKIASTSTYYTMWVGLASDEQAKKMVENLSLFEYEFGPTVCEVSAQSVKYQWDYPAGWPPIYFLVVKALDKYGYEEEALRNASKYLDVVAKNYISPSPNSYSIDEGGEEIEEMRQPGFVYEKYTVTDGLIYDAEYPSNVFHGWSYGVYVCLLDYYKNSGK